MMSQLKVSGSALAKVESKDTSSSSEHTYVVQNNKISYAV